jgi:hypothetical protein
MNLDECASAMLFDGAVPPAAKKEERKVKGGREKKT